MKLAKATIDEFFGIPVTARDGMIQDLADGLDAIFQEYISFLASCGTATITHTRAAATSADVAIVFICHYNIIDMPILCVWLNKQAPSRATSRRCRR